MPLAVSESERRIAFGSNTNWLFSSGAAGVIAFAPMVALFPLLQTA